jgi:ATP-dependent Lhr-like helicase
LRQGGAEDGRDTLSPEARTLLETLRARGASFLRELGLAGREGQEGQEGREGHEGTAGVVAALGELVAAGLAASDGFAGLRTIVKAASGRQPLRNGAAHSGRWSLLRAGQAGVPPEAAVEAQARALLRRYGVVFRRLLLREANAAPWRELARVYRRLEARGEIRGGRFVSGMSGEQFALADAVDRLREVRRTPADDRLVVISAADPLNLAGIVTSGDRVRAAASSRVAYLNGVPVAALEGDYIRRLAEIDPSISAGLATTLAGRRLPAVTSGYVGRVAVSPSPP